MPIPAAAVPLITAGIAAASQAGNAVIQGKMNKKSRQFALGMYNRQRMDALADWNMQNEYNSPEQQMQRLREAGLNPNLVYGHGAEAQSQSMPRSVGAPHWAPQAPQFDAGAVSSAYFDTQVRQAQIDNLAVQRTLMEQDIKNKQANEFKTWADAFFTKSKHKGQDISNQYSGSIKEMTLEGMRSVIENREKTYELARERQDLSVKKYELDVLKNGMSMKEAAERILTMRARRTQMEIENLQKQEQTLKTTFEIKNLIASKEEIYERIKNLQSTRGVTDENHRILQSTPDWGDKKAVDMLQSLLGRFLPQGGEKIWMK